MRKRHTVTETYRGKSYIGPSAYVSKKNEKIKPNRKYEGSGYLEVLTCSVFETSKKHSESFWFFIEKLVKHFLNWEQKLTVKIITREQL